ncbi:MAG: deoxynucleoside kinase [Candidatus Calescibacterium sp.]|nr:deoxynucleoside kinase [Candidatus Calescibacterium sp.]MDW8133222.1 deoxynucleoside kinase [Candidatus Calescibacterium sp.]
MGGCRVFAVVDGNIGAYKSTVLNLISKELGFLPVDEPWYENNFLDLFYQDKKRWAYSTQWEFFTIRAIRHMEAQNNTNENLLLERSVYSDRYVFARYLYEHGYMNDREWNSYTKWFDFLIEKLLKKPTFMLYLRAQPETLYERILQRSREIELQKDGITVDYIRGLNHYYDDFLLHNKFNLNIPMIVVETDGKFYRDNHDHRQELISKIRDFLNNLTFSKI